VPDLPAHIREYVDRAAEPISLDEVTAPAVELHPARARRGRGLAVAVVLVVLVGAIAVYAASRPERDQPVISGTTTTTTTTDAAPAWLTPFGEEVPMPELPGGWRLVDFEAIRFAVPPGWSLVQSCPDGLPQPGAAILPNDYPDARRCEDASSTPRLRVIRGDGPHGLAATTSSFGWDVKLLPERETAELLRTFTESGARRALQDGPVADTAGWRTVTFNGVALRVPSAWRQVDLLATPAFVDAPGACDGQDFPSDRPPLAFLNHGGVGCSYDETLDLGPGEGVWLRSAGQDPEAEPVTGGRIGGLEVSVVDIDESGRPDPALDLIANDGEHWVWISIGVGRDASVARAILRSLHRA
jgi:hypothetical protein